LLGVLRVSLDHLSRSAAGLVLPLAQVERVGAQLVGAVFELLGNVTAVFGGCSVQFLGCRFKLCWLHTYFSLCRWWMAAPIASAARLLCALAGADELRRFEMPIDAAPGLPEDAENVVTSILEHVELAADDSHGRMVRVALQIDALASLEGGGGHAAALRALARFRRPL
jgi:hypothetical protein